MPKTIHVVIPFWDHITEMPKEIWDKGPSDPAFSMWVTKHSVAVPRTSKVREATMTEIVKDQTEHDLVLTPGGR